MINYKILQDSIVHYEQCGFQRIESPWTVTPATSDITRPATATQWTIKEKDKVLVASGEQSFLYLYNKGFLPKGRFQTITPCFRDEIFDSWHTKYFIKNELIVTDDVTFGQLRNVILSAKEFFNEYCQRVKSPDYLNHAGSGVNIYRVTPSGSKLVQDVSLDDLHEYPQYDLIYCGVELGSYGIRQCEYLKWIYGTGVAEPRFSRVLDRYGISY